MRIRTCWNPVSGVSRAPYFCLRFQEPPPLSYGPEAWNGWWVTWARRLSFLP